MGADLYIEPDYSKVPEKSRWSNDNPYYYRDSYNDSNLLWTVGLSYWQDTRDLLTKNGYMSPANCVKWLKRFDEAKDKGQKFPQPESNESIEEIVKYFTEKEKRFREFFALAIRLKRKVLFSV